MVSNVAGTTRDAVDVPFTIKDHDEEMPAILMDTAGLRKRGRANTAVEVFSIMRAESAVKRADIVLLVIEADEYGSTSQDKKIAKMIEASGKGCIIVANKWDLCKGEKQKNIVDEIYKSLPFLRYAPVVCASAETGYNFPAILDEILNVKERMDLRVPTPLINRILHDAFGRTAPPLVGRRAFKVYYTTMSDSAPPQFLLFVNDPKICTKNYLAYLKNTLRQNLDFTGWPIELKLRKRDKGKK
jgi:GTP-binding protein